jgi:hypothetical protein
MAQPECIDGFSARFITAPLRDKGPALAGPLLSRRELVSARAILCEQRLHFRPPHDLRDHLRINAVE